MDTTVDTKAGTGVLSGTAYGRPAQHFDEELTSVKAGTPGGEYLRRYWQPVALSEEVTSRPRKVKLLGEDLIIFRNRKGKVGLLYPRCMHRGTSLFYGRVEEEGIRCCYHGWVFDTEGNCLEQPCEPENGRRRDAARQPWYPVKERYGLVFAYMGPPDKMPVLPRYDILETLKEGEFLQAIGGDGAVAYVDLQVDAEFAPYNWLQAWENVLDPFHVWILHATFGVTQVEETYQVKPTVEFERSGAGGVSRALRELDDGRVMVRANAALLPNIGVIPPVDVRGASGVKATPALGVVWYVATDDESWIAFTVQKTRQEIGKFALPMTPDGRPWSQMTEAEHRDYPGDFEAQMGQGATTLHSEEHLAQSDVGVVILRRLMRQQIKAVQNGESPLGVTFDEAEATVQIPAGIYFR